MLATGARAPCSARVASLSVRSAPPCLSQTFADDGFYIWLYERPASPWAWIWTALIPRGCLAAAAACSGSIAHRLPALSWLSTCAALCSHALCSCCLPPLAVGVVGACLFPLAPNWAKVAVFYLSSGLLFLILGVLLIRSVLALVTWVATGNTVWLLPNLSSEARRRFLAYRHGCPYHFCDARQSPITAWLRSCGCTRGSAGGGLEPRIA